MVEKIIAGYKITYAEAVALMKNEPLESLCEMANKLRTHFNGNTIDTCSIINARSGHCSEDCKWCSQSAHNKADVDIYPLLGSDVIVDAAIYNANKGVRRFSLVTSGRTMSPKEIDSVCVTYRKIAEKNSIKLCASMGLLGKPELQKLFDAGVRRYHCNIETAPSYFGKLCSTHTIEDKVQTIKWAREVGLTICSGGIIGMGETPEQRVEMAFKLREIGVDSIPLNVLNPIKGTPLEGAERLSEQDLLRSFAIFRIVNPTAHIRFAGGRTLITSVQEKALRGGVSAAIVGDMLTTVGPKIDQDIKMFKDMGYQI